MAIAVTFLLSLLLFNDFHESNASEQALVYVDFIDCGGGKILNLVSSVTPYPLIWVPPATLWLGGKASFTEEAKRLVANVSENEFLNDLQTLFFIDEPSWMIDILTRISKQVVEQGNNSKSCLFGPVLSREFCYTIYHGMKSVLKDFPILVNLETGKLISNDVFRTIVDYLLKKRQQINLQFRVKFNLYGETISCIKANIRISHHNFEEINLNDFSRKNVEEAFSTPKFIDSRRNETLSCPENANEKNDSTCQCPYPASGPFCLFKCSYDQFQVYSCTDNYGRDTAFSCEFDGNDYINHCLNGKTKINVLDGPIRVDYMASNHLEINFKLINFLTACSYEIELHDSAGYLGTIVELNYFNVEGTTTTYSMTSLCRKTVANGVRYKNKAYDFQTRNNCPELQLQSFTEYFIILQFGTAVDSEYKVLAETVNFTTPEAIPLAPKIFQAEFNEHENFIVVDWIINGRCPGYISRYQIDVSCSSDHLSSFGNLTFDCRSKSQGPTLKATFPGKCKSEDLRLTLRIGTNSSMSAESDPFALKNGSWPLLVIIAVAIGGFVIALTIGTAVFFYYYKRHVKVYQNLYKVFMKLVRHDDGRQSVRHNRPPNRPLPDPDNRNENSNAETVYQTIGSTPEYGTPRYFSSNTPTSQVYEAPNLPTINSTDV